MAKTLAFPLRFKTAKQKTKLEKIANKNGRSTNSQILHLIDNDIQAQEISDEFMKTGKIKYSN